MTRASKRAVKKPLKEEVPRLRNLPPRPPLPSIGKIEDIFKRECARWMQKYGEGSAYQAFCLDLHARLDMGMGDFLSDALTDGRGDKKVDFCHIDGTRALIAQGYHADKWGKGQASANKAEDLLSAVGWLLSHDTGGMPEPLRSKATDFQHAISDGVIASIDIYYVHNCHESPNVRDSLCRVEEMAKGRISAFRPPRDVGVHGYEIGLETVWELLSERDTPFLVGEDIKIPIIGTGFIEEENADAGWRALVMSVPAGWVRSQFKRWGKRLFAANVRDFLGAPDAKTDINSEIKRTVTNAPRNFWAFNNGITALTRKIMPSREGEVIIKGISVVNGAQTTGALGGMPEKNLFCTADPASARVLLRVIEIFDDSKKDDPLIKNITRYNNTQNRLYPEDMRSKDRVQVALHKDFKAAGVTYAHRRGERRQRADATIQSNVVARLLCAFHGDPETALRSYRRIFDDDEQYKRVFPRGLTASHVFLLDTLAEAFDEVKRDLAIRVADGKATQMEMGQLQFLAYSSAAKHFFFFIVGECSEEILGCQISDKHKWGVEKIGAQEREKYVKAWVSAVRRILTPLPRLIHSVGERNDLSNPLYSVPRSRKFTEEVAKEVKEFVQTQREDNPSWLAKVQKMSVIVD